MSVHNRLPLKRVRRRLRRNLTSAEATLWLHLRNSQLEGCKFRRQHSIGPYVVDFYCPSECLVLGLDGSTHDSPKAQHRDAERDAYLHRLGLRVIRILSREVIKDTQAVLTYLAQQIKHGS